MSDLISMLRRVRPDLPDGATPAEIHAALRNAPLAPTVTPPVPPSSATPPALWPRLRSLAAALRQWAGGGFGLVSKYRYHQRLSICRACPHWHPGATTGLGRCNKCGCITQLKLRLPASACPDIPPRW